MEETKQETPQETIQLINQKQTQSSEELSPFNSITAAVHNTFLNNTQLTQEAKSLLPSKFEYSQHLFLYYIRNIL